MDTSTHVGSKGGAKLRARNLRPPHNYSTHGGTEYCTPVAIKGTQITCTLPTRT